jgi:hypothetical protein
MNRSVTIGMLVSAALLLAPEPAGAQDTVSGAYIEGAGKVSVTIQSWGEDCGPKPKSYSTKGGKKVDVELKGDHLFFSDGSSTKKCWSDNTRLKRLSSAKKGNTWTTVCETPESDSRYEHGEYTIKVTEGGLTFVNASSYNWQLKTSMCKAGITIRKEYKKAGGKKVEPEPEPEPAEADKKTCKTTGSIARLVLSPSKAALGAGEKVCFQVYGLDAKGCRVAAPDARLSLSGPESAKDSVLSGTCFTAGTNAALSEGTFRVTASAGENLTDSSRIDVKFGNIEDLIAVNLDPSNLAGEGTQETTMPNTLAPSGFIEIAGPGRSRTWLWVVIALVAAGAVLGGIILISVTLARVGSARKKLKQTAVIDEREIRPAAPGGPVQAAAPAAPEPGKAKDPGVAELPAAPFEVVKGKPKDAAEPAAQRMWMFCEVCKKDFEPGSIHCPNDGSKLKPYRELTYQTAKSGLICPVCRRGYPNDFIQCPDDKEYLVPYAVFRSSPSESRAKPGNGKICPTCQKTFDESETFCAFDGTRLEIVQ